MSRHEQFKRRIGARMNKSGERYLAARKLLLDQAGAREGRAWIAEPDVNDEAVRNKTGRCWNEWCDLIHAWPGHGEGHTAIASWLRNEHDLDGWWAQGVTVGYERITGLRLPYQMADGTFTAGKSKTVTADATALRSMLLDNDERSGLFPGYDTALKSRPDSNTIRFDIGPGIASFSLEAKSTGRVKITVAHERLPEHDLVGEWKFYWSEWLDAIDDS